MLTLESTPNHAGVTIKGDFFDLYELYDALHEVVGEEEEYPSHYDVRLRVLALCYDLRHAYMGHREITFVDNGLDDELKRWQGILAPDKNVYLSVNVLWPELLFYTMVLNDFAQLHANKQTKTRYDRFEDKNVIWDPSLAQVRLFQSAVFECIRQTVSPTVVGRIKNMMVHDWPFFGDYTTQYLDVLNMRFLELDREKRVKNISIMVKRIVEKDDEYQHYWRAIHQEAKANNCGTDAIRLDIEYPDEIDW
ncbi:MAG TPA: hypothetical protein VJZ70_01525 [Limnochordia bacterium]|nr:hypothetical protein [Limnochordia bacterium]